MKIGEEGRVAKHALRSARTDVAENGEKTGLNFFSLYEYKIRLRPYLQ